MRLKFGLSFLVLMLTFNKVERLFAQDFHLTQADRSIPFLNPAFVGTYKGFEKLTLLNRNQWVGSGTQFLTSYGMAEFTPGRTRQSERAYAGIGASFGNDVGGDSRMTQKSFGLTASGHLPLAKGHWLDAGIQTAIQQRSADFSKLLYYSQWNGSTLDPNVYSGEENDFVSFAFVDASIGMAYRFEPNQRGELRDGQWSLQTGFSLQQHFSSFNGIALRPDSVPLWLENLRQLAYFRGQRFSQVNMLQVPEKKAVSFELRARQGAEQ